MNSRRPMQVVAALCLSISLLGAAGGTHAQSFTPGELDPTFGTGGLVTTVDENIGIDDVAIQADGKIVATGSNFGAPSYPMILVRSNSDGSLDSSFGVNGLVETPVGDEAGGNALIIQPDGKIVVTGYAYLVAGYDFMLVRYNSDGSLDHMFGADGVVVTSFGSLGEKDVYGGGVALQPDGKIVITGTLIDGSNYDIALARYNVDGSLDATFGVGGKVTTDFGRFDYAHDLVVQPDGRIVVAGFSDRSSTTLPDYDFAVVRYDIDGSMDLAFGDGGAVFTPIGEGHQHGFDVALEPDGQIVIAGHSSPFPCCEIRDFAVVRYNSDGSLDNYFGANGIVLTDFGYRDLAHAVAIQSNDKIVVGGFAGSRVAPSFTDFALARYNPDGSLDVTFGLDGKVTTDFYGGNDYAFAAVIQPDGKIVLGGSNYAGWPGLAFLARYQGDAISDADGDGWNDEVDNAPNAFNPDQLDLDGDGLADVVDGCPSDATNTCDQSASAASAIGSDGGTLVTEDQSTSIEIPPDALAEYVSLSITDGGSGFTVGTDQGDIEAVLATDIGPEGTVFATPITITFGWTDADSDGFVDATTFAELQLLVSKDGIVIAGPCGADAGCDMVANTFAVQVWSLSVFAVGAQPNRPPAIVSINAPVAPVQAGSVVEVSAAFEDPDIGDSHTAVWTWGDGATSDGTIVEETISGSHEYSLPGVYTIGLTVTDFAGASATVFSDFVVIYDPEGGFVTGGGWIDSPLNAYAADPSLTGKATFGFVSKYLKGANVPSGNTEFQFKVADLSFKSTSYDWLVVAGPKAQFKGSGTINGTGDYAFMLSAIDGQVNGGREVDKFRIKIWDKATEVVVYDNQMDAEDDAVMTTPIQGGSIVVHK